MEILLFILAMTVGAAIGSLWREKAYRDLLAEHRRWSDRDERGRFVKRDR